MRHCLLVAMMWLSATGAAQPTAITFEEAEQLSQNCPKPFFIYIKTEGCKFCKMMESITFKDARVIERISNDYYYIVLNASDKSTIHFNQRIWTFRPSGIGTGVHQLAEALGTVGFTLSFPTVILMSPQYIIEKQIPSFISAADLLKTL